ncbi:MAG TPA: phosphoesterase [Bacteroidales bacterium]|nr:phosphoesterase [Bacteroidales bacterium]
MISFHTTSGKGIFTTCLTEILMKSNSNLITVRRKRRVAWIVMSAIIMVSILFMAGTIHGRFNFKYETVEIDYDSLPAILDGFTIIHVSDLHLNSFDRHKKRLKMVIDSINSYNADIIVNTGDFVTILWDEMKPYMDILSELKARYGVYAIPGNHDTGLYSGEYNQDNYHEHLKIIGDMLRYSGYIYLEDSSAFINIDTLTISMTGVATYGRVPHLYYGNIEKARKDTEGGDFNILLTHDPNHWVKDVRYRHDINLTLSGHTHGMQIGILLPGFKLSPASLLYPAWSGLYGKNNNYLYVNRGLGTIGMPARIGMPPAITIIKLKNH